MAEFLVKAVDATHADPTTDAVGCYKRGYIVDVRPDGFAWGKEEHPATASQRNFVLIKIPGLDADKARNAVAQPERSDMVFEAPGGLGVVVRRRRFQLAIDSIPASLLAQLKATGVVTVSWAAVRAYITDHKTNATMAGVTL